MLVPATHYTYSTKGEINTSIQSLDDKRQVTAVMAVTFNGEFLPLQLLFGGQDTNRNVKKSVPNIEDPAVLAKISDYHLTQTKSHWSTLDCMKDYIRSIIVPFVTKKARLHNLQTENPHKILVLDCWKVQKSKDFLDWMQENYPHFYLAFVPARCTGELQPCDVLIQRTFKAEIAAAYNT